MASLIVENQFEWREKHELAKSLVAPLKAKEDLIKKQDEKRYSDTDDSDEEKKSDDSSDFDDSGIMADIPSSI